MAIRDIIQGGPVVIPSDSRLFASKPQYFDLDARIGGLSAYHEPRGRKTDSTQCGHWRHFVKWGFRPLVKALRSGLRRR